MTLLEKKYQLELTLLFGRESINRILETMGFTEMFLLQITIFARFRCIALAEMVVSELVVKVKVLEAHQVLR